MSFGESGDRSVSQSGKNPSQALGFWNDEIAAYRKAKANPQRIKSDADVTDGLLFMLLMIIHPGELPMIIAQLLPTLQNLLYEHVTRLKADCARRQKSA